MIEVAVGILIQPDGRVLLASRPEGKPYPGYWEFPGGKLEAGETSAQALTRELHEELGIEVERADPWMIQVFEYRHATVRLHLHRVRAWRGEPHGKESQQLAWIDPAVLTVEPLLPANFPILRALALPARYGITDISRMGDAFWPALTQALQGGLKLLQVREKTVAAATRRVWVEQVLAQARPAGAQVLVNRDIELAVAVGADGVHLNADQLTTLNARPQLPLVGASCHTADDLRRAAALGCTFAVLGPVLPTPSHADAAALGWSGYAELIRDTAIPVYALGGLDWSALDTVCRLGGHGVAAVRAAW